MIKIFISLLFVLFYSSASVATESSNESSVNKPTFDCDEARSKAEKIICSSSDLSKLDQELATLYKQAKVIYSDNKDFKTEHNIEWKRRETECLDEDCITKWYENRKSQLNNWIEKSNLNISNNAKGISVVNGKDNNKSRINYSTYSNSSIIYVDPEKLSDFIAYIALIIFFLIVIGYIYKNSSSYKYGSNDNKKIVITKNYKGNQSESIRKFRDDAIEMARHGYFPTSQTWIQGNWGCSAFLIALILCFILIGFLVFIYMLIVKPEGYLSVVYELRKVELVVTHDIHVEEKICPKCAESIKAAAIVCRYCGYEFVNSLPKTINDEIQNQTEQDNT